NLVAHEAGTCGAVLIRAAEPVEGLDVIVARRGGKSGTVLLAGPGKIASALALDLGFNHEALYAEAGLEVRDGPAPGGILVGPRGAAAGRLATTGPRGSSGAGQAGLRPGRRPRPGGECPLGARPPSHPRSTSPSCCAGRPRSRRGAPGRCRGRSPSSRRAGAP